MLDYLIRKYAFPVIAIILVIYLIVHTVKTYRSNPTWSRWYGVFIAVVCILLLLLVFGTSANTTDPLADNTATKTESTVETAPFAMELMADNGSYQIHRDSVTDVLMLSQRFRRGEDLIEMVDPDTGLPLTYAKYMEIATEVGMEEDLFTFENFANDFSDGFIYKREVVTDVIYLSHSGNQSGTLTVLTDPDTGTPLLYSKYMSLTQSKGGS